MEKLSRIYAVTSVLFLLAFLVSPLKDHFREWRAIQKQYNIESKKLPQKTNPAPMALQQIWARDLDRVDRCTTCHLSISDSRWKKMKQPFKTHPKIPHDMNKFGCTICHQGQGLATEYADAHLSTENWDKPILPARYLEASCGRCHLDSKSLDLTPNLNRGRELLSELHCYGCHEIPGTEKQYVPSLAGIGEKILSRSWMVRWLKSPSDIMASAKMPRFFLSDEEIEILTDFLLSFKDFPNGASLDSLPAIYYERRDDDSFINMGKARFREARCISCHKVNDRGGHLAPDLGKIASKAKPEWIYNFIKNPKKFQPEVEMPQYGFSDEQLAAILAYMESEFVDWEAPEEDSTHEPIANFFEKGLAIFNRNNCGGCHQLPSEKVADNPGPDLTAVGSKRIYELDFGKSNIPHTLFNYINAKIKSPHDFGESTRMPQYNLDDNERDALTTALLSFTKEDIPAKFLLQSKAAPNYSPQGEIGNLIKKYSCLKCHAINGTGGDIAPDLSIVGSQLQREWMKNYFKVPYSLRAIVEERMPNLFISEEEIDLWTDYAYTVLLDDEIPENINWESSKTSVTKGRELFLQRYGCRSCHIAEGSGGYVGPPLDGVGSRLKPGWVYSWIMNPQKYKPKTIEPRSGMSDEEARYVVAYLMSLKNRD